MKKSAQKQIEVPDHWRAELTKIRCWITGYQAGRHIPGGMDLESSIPGEQVLRQIIMAIDDAKE